MWKWWTVIHYSRKLDGLAHKHIIVALRPLEIEVSSLNWRGYRLSGFRGRLGRRPLIPIRGMRPVSAGATCLEEENVPGGREGASVVNSRHITLRIVFWR